MSKFKIFLAILALVLLIFFLIVGINTITRMHTLNKILNKAISNLDKDNYSLKTICKSDEYKSETMAYYRNGIGRLVAENGIYTWTDGKDAYMVDETNKVLYVLPMNDSPEMLVGNDMYAYLYPGYDKGFFEKLRIAGNMFNKFKTETINDEECYKIVINEEKYVKTTWISKKNLLPVKATMTFPSGETLEYTYDLRFTATKLTSIELPDLDEYKILDYKTGEVIVEEFITENSNEQTEAEVTNEV